MRELPLLMNTPMVQALLADRKTQTRRPIKPQPETVVATYQDGSLSTLHGKSRIYAPYQVFDLLWVRETFYTDNYRRSNNLPVLYKADGEQQSWKPSIFMPKQYARIWREVTEVRAQRIQEISKEDCYAEGVEFVMVTDQDGHVLERITTPAHANYHTTVGKSLVKAYFAGDLWDSQYAKKGLGWDTNCWTWAYTLRKVER